MMIFDIVHHDNNDNDDDDGDDSYEISFQRYIK